LKSKPRWPRESAKPTKPKSGTNGAAPRFAPLDQLQIGEPFNPYVLFVYGDVLREVLRFGKLKAGDKLLWILLADQCQKRGTDKHSQSSLAVMLGMSPRQLRRHMQRLKKLKMVHVEWALGMPARTWLLYHPVFALCSPRGTDKNVLTLGQERPKGWDRNGHNMDLPHGSLHGIGDTTFDVGTSNRGTSEARAEEKPKIEPAKLRDAPVPITNRVSTLSVSEEAKAFWYSLSPLEKQKRSELAAAAAERVAYYRQYLNETDPTIASTARREVKRYLGELRGFGFFIPGTEQKGKT
jgi:hypothetical protein